MFEADGAHAMTVTGLHRPMDVAIDAAGHYIVAEWETGFVAVVDPTRGTILRRFQVHPVTPALPSNPEYQPSNTNLPTAIARGVSPRTSGASHPLLGAHGYGNQQARRGAHLLRVAHLGGRRALLRHWCVLGQLVDCAAVWSHSGGPH